MPAPLALEKSNQRSFDTKNLLLFINQIRDKFHAPRTALANNNLGKISFRLFLYISKPPMRISPNVPAVYDGLGR